MKILFTLENTMDNLEGGTEVSSRHLAGLLLKKGVEVEEWAPFNRRKPIFWYTSIFGQIYILIVLAWKLVKNRVQILHAQGKYLIPPVVIAGKFLRIPTVVTIRDYMVVCPIGLCLFKGPALPRQGRAFSDPRHGFWFYLTKEITRFLSIYHPNDSLMIRIIRHIFLLRGWLVTQWLRFWLKRVDAVVSVSKYVQSVLDTSGIKSEAIYNVFDPDFTLESNKARPCRGKAGPLNTILFVGKPSYGKGYDLFRLLSCNKLFQDFEFITIGGDTKLPYLETLQKIKEAITVVVPSRWPEPFGRVALESLMMGTPAVATNKGGLEEIIEDGLTGALVEPTPDGLSSGLSDVIERNSEFRRKIRLLNSELKEKFISSPVQKYLKLYQSLSNAALVS